MATPPENARLYFKFRPTRLRLAADPELSRTARTACRSRPRRPELMEAMAVDAHQSHRRVSRAAADPEAATAIDRLDGYAETETDQADMEQQWPQLKGQFLIDRDGIVRWANIECAAEGFAGVGKFPSEEEILAAARALPRR